MNRFDRIKRAMPAVLFLFRYKVVSPSGYTKSVQAESKWHAIDLVRKMELENCPTIDGKFAYGVNLYTVKRIN